jgi:L-2-hydroxyglutarate oxidase
VTNITVIGGGIVGLATAYTLSQRGAHVTVLEKEDHWAGHQTGHNSGVIHAGPYYKPGSLKARMCTAGNASMVRFAAEHGIAHDVCGKLIVATSAKEVPGLETLRERGTKNGTPLRMVSPEEAREIEPHVNAVKALAVTSTGIIDYAAVCGTLASLVSDNGGELKLGTTVRAIREENSQVVVEHDGGVIRSDMLVNCAGLQSDKIAAMAGFTPEVQIVPFRGEYYELVPEKHYLVNNLIYPVPDPELPFLGVHFTRMIDGSRHAGPNAVFALAREAYSWRTFSMRETVEALTYPGLLKFAPPFIGTGIHEFARSLSKRLFAHSLAKLIPAVRPADIVRAGAGIRAQAITRNGKIADDFIIQRSGRQVHVLNAPSPAATASLEIGQHIAATVLGEPSPYDN